LVKKQKGRESFERICGPISGMVAIAVIEYFAALEIGSNSIGKNLVGVTRVLDLFDPMNPDNASNTNSYWQPHGLCGCQQLL